MARTDPGSFYADNYTEQLPSGPMGAIQTHPFVFTLQATNPTDGILLTGDKLYLCVLNPGPSAGNPLDSRKGGGGWVLYDLRIDIPDIDSGSALVFQLGDSTAADRYVTVTLAGAIGQTAGVVSSFGPSVPYGASDAAGVVAASLPARYVAQDALILTVQTQPAGMNGLPLVIQGYIQYQQIGQSPLTATV